jgi:hypothetical protein
MLPVVLMWSPTPLLPEITLRAPGTVPPMVLSVPKLMVTPLEAVPMAATPVTSTPMWLP